MTPAQVAQSVKSYVRRHKKTLIWGASLTSVILLQNRGIQSLNEFLKEKELYEEYYHNNEI